MDSSKRTLAKAVTWQLMGLVSMTIVGLLFTGSIKAGSGIAITGTALGFVTYFLHEKVWLRVRWGRRSVDG